MPARPPALSEERERLAREIRALLAPYAHHRTFEAGTLLWREGDDSGMLVALESGRVKIFRVLPTGSAVPLVVVELPVRAREFAAAIGIAPESLSRALTKLVEAGVLHRLGPRKLQVLDSGALRKAAGAPG